MLMVAIVLAIINSIFAKIFCIHSSILLLLLLLLLLLAVAAMAGDVVLLAPAAIHLASRSVVPMWALLPGLQE